MTKSDTTIATPKNQQIYDAAIANGLDVLKNGGSKADAARAIFDALDGEDREIVIRAFVEGATLTEKGAPTYFYNITRKARRTRGIAKEQQQRANKKGKKPESETPVE